MSTQRFIPFTEQDQLRASEVDLALFLQSRGERLERVGREHKLIYTDGSGTHDSITVSGNRWYDHKNQCGGGPIKLLREHFGMTYQEAMLELLGGYSSALEHAPSKPKEQPKKEFKLPDANENMRRVYAYLAKQRFIAPEIISHFAKEHKIYEDSVHHNAVFVGMDENNVPRQAHKRSTITFGKSFRQTVDGSDTRYSFSHFGVSGRLFVFEAPIDMLSYITLNPQDWQKHSYIAMNGVYENAVLTALKSHLNLDEIYLCTDNDEGGIEAVDRLKDILNENGFANVSRLAPTRKDWNEDLKHLNGMSSMPSVPHQRKACYRCAAAILDYKQIDLGRLSQQLMSINLYDYESLASTALSSSAVFLTQSKYNEKSAAENFALLKNNLREGYKPYTDKCKTTVKVDNLKKQMREVVNDLHSTSAQTATQMKDTAKRLYLLADCALRCQADEMILSSQQEVQQEEETPEQSEDCRAVMSMC